LKVLVLSFPAFESRPEVKATDDRSIEAAKKVMAALGRLDEKTNGEEGKRTLIVRRRVAPHYTNNFQMDEIRKVEEFVF
jgi:hypothetical protein